MKICILKEISSGMQGRVVRYNSTDIPEELITLIFGDEY
jgi:hypothetical protein